MRVTYYTHFPADVSVHEVTDDFGNVLDLMDIEGLQMSYRAFTSAKLFVTGMTFEGAGYLSLVPVYQAH